MPITLKHINYADSNNIKLAKVNYNFDQLVANGGGPMGPQGALGQSGPQGTTGQMGFQGPIGDQGFQGPLGPATGNFWNKIPASAIDVETLNPVSNALDQFAPVVNIGYVENDPEYGPTAKLPLVGGKTQFQWRINRRSNASTNLRFLNSNLPGNLYDFKLQSLGAIQKMSMGFYDIGSGYTNSISTYKAGTTSFKGSNPSTESLTINDTAATFYTDTVFDSPAVIKRNLIIQDPTAATDKIAISSDNTGWVKFKSVQELGGTVPFGTIVSILPSIYADNSNFINSETINQGDTSPINITAGRGVGNYAGWYLCNGQQWTDGVMSVPELVNYNVPKLGNFIYDIEDNGLSSSPFGQGVAITPSPFKTHITGGSDIGMDVNLVSGLSYTVTSTVSASDVEVGPNNGTTYKLKQLPQIIYLGRNDLYWQQPGTNQNPPVPLNIFLDDINTGINKLNPDPYTVANINNQPANVSHQFQSFDINLTGGYYWSGTAASIIASITGLTTLPPYLTITGVTFGTGTYPTSIKINFSVSSHPSTAANITLGINTSGLITLATVPITLIRHDNSYGTSPTQYYTCSTPSTTTVNYNFNTGYYDYQLVYTAQPGYTFATTQFPGIFGATVYDGGFAWSPPAGSGWIIVKGPWTDYSLSNGNTTLTVNLRLDQVPLTGYATTIGYEIQILTNPTAPRISAPANATAEISPNNGTGIVTKNLTIENSTGGTVYLWVGIHQFYYTGSGGNAAISAEALFYYTDWLGFLVSELKSVGAIATTTGNFTNYSPSYTLPTGSTISCTFKRFATTDGQHDVKIYWSTSSLVTSTKTPILY